MTLLVRKRPPTVGVPAALALAVACGGAGRAPEAPAAAEPESAAPATASSEPSEPEGAPSAPAASAASAEPPARAPGSPTKSPPAEPPPLPEGTTVLHIGDSFAGALGIDLNKELKARGVRGVLKYETSSYIPTWASSKDLNKYLWQYKPDLVLITLGANELEVPDPEIRAETIQRLVKRLDGRPCVWIAPPLWEGARDVLIPVIEQNSKPCVFLSNAEIAGDMARAKDNIHPSMNARRDWARYVVDWLARHRIPAGDRPWEMRGEP